MFTRTKGPSTRCSTKCSNSNGKVPTRLRQTQTHVRSGVTSLAGYLADPKRLLTVTRSHWGSEHGLHHRRDVTSAAKTTLRFVWAMRRKCWRSSTLSCLDSLLDKVRPMSLMPGAILPLISIKRSSVWWLERNRLWVVGHFQFRLSVPNVSSWLPTRQSEPASLESTACQPHCPRVECPTECP